MADPLRVITCGSSGDAGIVLVERLVNASKDTSTTVFPVATGDPDCRMTGIALLLEEMPPEHRHGLTVDADFYRLRTTTREIIVADASRHERSTFGLTTVASTAQLAVIAVDAAKGVGADTRRVSRIVALAGIKHVALAVYALDTTRWDSSRVDTISDDYRELALHLGLTSVAVIPLAAIAGANGVANGVELPGYQGPSLLEYLNGVDIRERDNHRDADASSDQFEVRLVWRGEHALVAGRRYVVRTHAEEVTGSVSAIKYRLDVDSGAHLAARRLSNDDIGVVNLSLDATVPFAPYERDPRLGALLLIDHETREVVGAGMIDFALRRAENLHWQQLSLDKQARSRLKHQAPRCIWLTGLSGSGKSTIANLLESQLHGEGLHTFVLDGDNVRHGLNRDLGFTEADRVENLRRVAEVAKLMVEAGLIVIVSFISPFRTERASARSLFADGEFVEVFIDTPLEECERRDPKGLYAKARAGRLINFTGIDSPYEPPENPEMRLPTAGRSPAESAQQLYAALWALRPAAATL